jgi:group I intron endonuclease
MSDCGQTKKIYKGIGFTGIVFVSLLLNNNIMAKDRTEYLKEYHKRTYVPTGNKQGRPTELPQYDFAGIYQLKCIVNNKIYIGQAQNILRRFNDHRKNRNGHLIYRDCVLYRAIKKYGWDKFEISVLERVDNFGLLNEREIFWIDKLNPEYNMKDGGDCARGWNHTEKAKKKMSETKSKMYLGKNNPFYGKTHSEETKEKIRQARFGKKLSKEHRDKISKSNKSYLRKKKVVQCDLEGNKIMTHTSVNEAAKHVGVSQGTMSSHLTGRNKTCKGYVFRYA